VKVCVAVFAYRGLEWGVQNLLAVVRGIVALLAVDGNCGPQGARCAGVWDEPASALEAPGFIQGSFTFNLTAANQRRRPSGRHDPRAAGHRGRSKPRAGSVELGSNAFLAEAACGAAGASADRRFEAARLTRPLGFLREARLGWW